MKETSSSRDQICPHNVVSQVLITLTYCSMTFSTACRSASTFEAVGFSAQLVQSRVASDSVMYSLLFIALLYLYNAFANSVSPSASGRSG